MTPYELNFRHLLAVRAIAERGGLSHAAEVVHLSQPALTQALSKLERSFGLRLFDRRADGMTPTAAGSELVDRVDRAARELAGGFEAIHPRTAISRASVQALVARTSFTHLRAVIAAVESGNFILATRATGISPPALHRAVRDFERMIGVTLFERQGRTVTPTPKAKTIVAAARRAVAEIDAALANLGVAGGEDAGRVAIGAMPLARSELVPRAVAAFLRELPAATVKIADGSYADLMARLLGGDLDLLVGALRFPPPSTEIQQHPLYEDRLKVVAGAGHPLASNTAISLHDLARQRWIMAPLGTPMRSAWTTMFEGANITAPPVSVECSSVLAIHALLIESDCLTLLSPAQIAREVASQRLVALDFDVPGGERIIGATVRAGWRPSKIQARFLQQLSKHAVAT